MMRRREFITLLGGATAWPIAALAQRPTIPVIGFLNSEAPKDYVPQMATFRRGLSEMGYVEGRNVAIEFRWAEQRNEQLSSLAADLVSRQVAVIAAPTTPAVLAAKLATATIPIVFYTGGDPIVAGLVASLNRPGGNLTGVVNLNVELAPKRLELLHEVVPTATVVAVLINPTSPILAEATTRDLQKAARALGLQLHVLNASTESEIEAAFAALAQLQAGALLIGTDPMFVSRSEQLAKLTVRYGVPAIFQYRAFAAAGGLMSYGGSITDAIRLVGVYTGRILKGERPADLPVQQSTKVELNINLKTAKALGITMPLPLIGRADEVIE